MAGIMKKKYIIMLMVLSMVFSCLYGMNMSSYSAIYSNTDTGVNGYSSRLIGTLRSMQPEDALTGEILQGTKDGVSYQNYFRIKRTYVLCRNLFRTADLFKLVFFALILFFPAVLIHACLQIRRWHIIKYIHLKDGAKQFMA